MGFLLVQDYHYSLPHGQRDVKRYWPRRMNSFGAVLANPFFRDTVSGWKLFRFLKKIYIFPIYESNVLLTLRTIFEWTVVLSAEARYSEWGVSSSKRLAQRLHSLLCSGGVKCEDAVSWILLAPTHLYNYIHVVSGFFRS